MPSSPPSIADYALIGDCHSAALVSDRGSIDWCCMPRFDSGSCFGRLLAPERGGHCSIEPVDGDAGRFRAYLGETLVLATTFRTEGGQVRVLDCFTIREGGRKRPHHQILRVIEGERGHVDMAVEVVPRFDYAEVRPAIRRHGMRVFSAIGGDDGLVISGDLELEPTDDGHGLAATVSVRPGVRARLSIVAARPEAIEDDPPEPADADELDARLETTRAWWDDWVKRGTLEGMDAPGARRSAIVLKALSHAPTGAIVAAPTTSLPEAPSGKRNWDYRYSWVRDSSFSVRALAELGFESEADGFRRFIQRSAAGNADELQVMYGVGGERRLTQLELDGLDGYRGAKPVHVGNQAAEQFQLDAYGELVNLSWRWSERGHTPDDDQWRFLDDLVRVAVERWSEPDQGFWEWAGPARHFVQSKAMCWSAIEHGLALAEAGMRRVPERKWKHARDEIAAAIERRGYDERRGVFLQSFDHPQLDAVSLLLPVSGFVAWDDERMVRTADAIAEELDDGGLLRRYLTKDNLPGHEGAFIACTFWLAECLAHQSREEAARSAFDRAFATANQLGLFSEEYDSSEHDMLGNFPQGLTHLSHISAAAALEQARRRAGTGGAVSDGEHPAAEAGGGGKHH